MLSYKTIAYNLLHPHIKLLNTSRALRLRYTSRLVIFGVNQHMGSAPWAKPDDCIQIIMENFNSLGVFMSNTKISTMNKLCQEFNTDVLAGCKTQVDWHQATEEQQFKNVIEDGMETRIIIAHNINKQMQ